MIKIRFTPLNTKLCKRWMILGLLITFAIIVVMPEEAEGIFSSYSIAKLKEQSLNGKSIGPNKAGETKHVSDAPGFQRCINELKSPNPSVRLEAVNSLGFFKDKRAVQFIIPLVKDPARPVRQAAVEALGSINDPQGVVAIIPALKDPALPVRQAAVEALRRIKDPQGVVAIIPALKDANLNNAAFQALWEINEPQTAIPLISAWKDIDYFVQRGEIERLLVHLGKASVEPLLGEVNDYNIGTAGSEVLGMLIKINKNAVEPLIGVLGDKNKNIWSRFMAARALGVIKDERAIEPLGAALKGEALGLRKEANTALIDITNKDFQEDYNRYLEWWRVEQSKKKQ